MSLPKSRGSYQSCYDLFDSALENEKGVRIPTKNYTSATMLRMRLHMARQLDRDYNRERYQPGEFMHGASEYDKLTVKLRQTNDEPPKFFVYIEHNDIEWGDVELLTEVVEETRVAIPPLPAPAYPMLPRPQQTVQVESLQTGLITRRRI